MNRRSAMPVVGASPRASLLPPEIRVRAHNTTLARLMIASVAGIAVLSIGAVGVSSVLASSASAELDRARAQTAALLAEQTTYSEAADLEAQVATATAARTFAASTEIAWAHYLALATVTMPTSMTLRDVTAGAAAPWESSVASTAPLRGPAVASFRLTVSAGSERDITNWVRGLAALPGYADSSIDAVSFTDAVGANTAFTSTVTLNLTTDARTGRFAPAESEPEPAPDPNTGTTAVPVGATSAESGE